MLFPPCAHLLWWYWRDASCIVFVNSARLGLHAPFCRIMSAEERGHHSIKQLPLLSLPFSLALNSWGGRSCRQLYLWLRKKTQHKMLVPYLSSSCPPRGGSCGRCDGWRTTRPILLRFLRVASSISGQKHGVISCSCCTAELWSLAPYSLQMTTVFKGVLPDQVLKLLS